MEKDRKAILFLDTLNKKVQNSNSSEKLAAPTDSQGLSFLFCLAQAAHLSSLLKLGRRGIIFPFRKEVLFLLEPRESTQAYDEVLPSVLETILWQSLLFPDPNINTVCTIFSKTST